MSTASDRTYSVHVSGPSPHLAFLRAVLLKISGVLQSAWATARLIISAAARLPGAVATAVTATMSNEAGYSNVIGGIRGFFGWVWKGVSSVARFAGGLFGKIARAATTLVGHVSPAGADFLHALTNAIGARFTSIATTIDSLVRTVGEVLWLLLNTTMVRTASTVAAGIAAAVMVIHEASSGVVATWLAQQVPSLVNAIAWMTNPWLCLAAVAACTVTAMGVAFLRLLHASKESTADVEGGPDDPDDGASVGDSWDQWKEQLGDLDLDAVVSSLHISIAPDGSVIVDGIPPEIPASLRKKVAQVAADAAVRQWERTARKRRTPSRDDRRLFTKAARDAVRNRMKGDSRHQGSFMAA